MKKLYAVLQLAKTTVRPVANCAGSTRGAAGKSLDLRADTLARPLRGITAMLSRKARERSNRNEAVTLQRGRSRIERIGLEVDVAYHMAKDGFSSARYQIVC